MHDFVRSTCSNVRRVRTKQVSSGPTAPLFPPIVVLLDESTAPLFPLIAVLLDESTASRYPPIVVLLDESTAPRFPICNDFAGRFDSRRVLISANCIKDFLLDLLRYLPLVKKSNQTRASLFKSDFLVVICNFFLICKP